MEKVDLRKVWQSEAGGFTPWLAKEHNLSLLGDTIGTERVVWWETTRKRERRIVVALPDFSYVVVLANRKGYVLPWTAYPVEREHRRKKLRRECEEFWAGQKS
jgi:hypothetical protein